MDLLLGEDSFEAVDGVGGILNATFGNIAELIIAFFALQAGLIQVVKASLTGSIIGFGASVRGRAVSINVGDVSTIDL